MSLFRREMRERKPARQEGEEGYDPYDFEEDEAASADESGGKRLLLCTVVTYFMDA